ncbi:MAG: hypothetical protein JRH16_12520 [Deltaproteobacteria bacterium]|nr:hypothetical protein [Deltaproteobacteria bacterium]MBW2361399.1 hypothetical protein [Deltaproteobacteria bacterium]
MRRSALTALAVALASFACRTPLPPLAPLAPEDPRPAQLLASFAVEVEARRGLRGRARLSVDAAGGDVRLRGKQVIVLEKPERLRVEIKALFDQTLAVLVTDAGQFELLRADDQSYRRGAIEPGLLWETAWLDLTPSDAIELLLAAPSIGERATLRAARGDAEGGVELDLAGGDGQLGWRLRFDAEGRLSWLERFDAAGTREWRVEYSDYIDVGASMFPHRLRLITAADTRAEVKLSDVELNPELPGELFRLRPR